MENLEFKLEDLWPIIGMNTLSKRNKNTLNTSGEGFIIKSKKDYRDALKYTAFCAYQAAAMMIISDDCEMQHDTILLRNEK